MSSRCVNSGRMFLVGEVLKEVALLCRVFSEDLETRGSIGAGGGIVRFIILETPLNSKREFPNQLLFR